MEQQRIKHLLQTKIFSHPSIQHFNPYSQRVLQQLSRCHTAQLGYHVYGCDKCSHQHYQYHSCGNRHCPNCGGLKREQWLQDRMSELLPTTYYHIVFTLPQELRSLVMGNRKLLFNLLFEASTHTLKTLGNAPRYLGAAPGVVSILHTNGQDLSFHPHIHCIVSGGGLSKEGTWIKEKRERGNFLFPRRAMEKLFKGYFLEQINSLKAQGKITITNTEVFSKVLNTVRYKKWNVYAKAPFGGPEQVVSYLGRYTHKVAITTHRIVEITAKDITFKYKDYQDKNKTKEMTLSHEEFLRRFEQHILPKGFVKIRHSGYLSHQNKGRRLGQICEQLSIAAPPPKVKLPAAILAAMTYGVDITVCKMCHQGKMICLATFVHVDTHLVHAAALRNRGSPIKIQQPIV